MSIMASEKKIGGKRFYKEDSGYTPLKAKSKASALRKEGYNVRTVRDGSGNVTLYRRHKGK